MDGLAALVERTRGPQPWRKLFHATNGVAVASALSLLPVGRWAAVSVLGGVLAALVVMDLVRLTNRRANELFFVAFPSLASPREARGVASSTWYTLGVGLAVALFSRHDAISGVLVLALADPAASYVGQRWGRTPFLGGTVRGSLAFFVVAGAILALRHDLPVALAAAIAVTLAERRSWPLDDNLTIPVACAAVLALMGVLQ